MFRFQTSVRELLTKILYPTYQNISFVRDQTTFKKYEEQFSAYKVALFGLRGCPYITVTAFAAPSSNHRRSLQLIYMPKSAGRGARSHLQSPSHPIPSLAQPAASAAACPM